MFCEKCGKQLPDNSAFCDGCGSPVAAPAAAPASADATVAAPAKPKIELNKKTLTGIAVVAAAIIVIILAVVLIANAGGGDAPLLYVTDGELVMATNVKKGEKNVIDDEYLNSDVTSYYGYDEQAEDMTNMAKFTEDNKKFIFLNNMDEDDQTLDLVWVETKKLGKEGVADEIVKISSGVKSFHLADEADSLLYTKDGKLYRYDFKEDPVLISKDVTSYTQTADGKYISYIKTNDDQKELYVYTVKTAEATKVDSKISNILTYDKDNAFANMIYTKYDSDDSTYEVYTGGIGKDKEKLFSDASSVISGSAGKGVYFYETDDEWVNTLYYFDIAAGEKTEISDCYSDYNYVNAKAGVIVYSEVDKDYEYTYYISVNGFDPVEVDEPISAVSSNTDGNMLYVITREEDEEDPIGTLTAYEIGKNGLGKGTKLADEVYCYAARCINDEVYYYTDYDADDYTGTLYHWTGKEGVKLADEVYLYSVSKLDDDTVSFFSDVDDAHGTMYVYSGKKAEKVSADVYYTMYGMFGDDVIFLTDYDEKDGGTLNLWNGKEKTKVATDVQGVIIP